MSDQANEFLKDYQAFAQQSWDAWMRYMQQPGPLPVNLNPATPGDDLLTRTLSHLKQYGSWLQQAAGAGLGQTTPWTQAATQPFFAAFGQPFGQTVAGLDSATAFGLDHQWQSWMQAMQRMGAPGVPGQGGVAAFGLTREMQLDQQALAAAMGEYAQVNARYQALLQKVTTQGVALLQDLFARRAESGQQVESLKSLYDLWVDAMEEAYAAIALTDEYREIFGALVDAQMRVRKLQQRQTEQWCRELGIPTRSEVESLGRRMQELRREWRARKPDVAPESAPVIDALRAEIAALKRELAVSQSPAKATQRAKTARPASAKRK